MILDVERFAAAGRPHWQALERLLDRLESGAAPRLTPDEVRAFHRLYERATADLGRLATYAAEPELRRHLEALVARAYGEVHATPESLRAWSPWRWFTVTFPQTFRRHRAAWRLSVLATLAGAVFGALALALDPQAKAVIMPFPHLLDDPAVRVAKEEAAARAPGTGDLTGFSTMLMTHNTRVSIATLALGATWGVGTLAVLSYNGVILGAVAADYLLAGQARFLAGWLLPHGAVEIPAILIAGQGGFVLAGAMLGRGDRRGLRTRLRAAAPDLATLIGGVALLLVWAGIVEAFLSQYHEPRLPYGVKIAFGVAELAALAWFLAAAGRRAAPAAEGRRS